jgi:hypothetical protein
MARNRRLFRLTILSAGLLAIGLTGATMSRADASQSAGKHCSSSGGLLSAATGTLCKTLDSATSGTKKLVDGATGGATSGVTSAAQNTVGGAASAVNSLGGSQGGTSSDPAGSSSGAGTGPQSSGGSRARASGSSKAKQGASAPSRSAGRTLSPAESGPLAVGFRAAVIEGLLRRLGLTGLSPQLPGAGQTASQSALQLPTVQPGRGVQKAKPIAHAASSVNPTGTVSDSPWLLLGLAVALAGGIGLVYAGWRNADLFHRDDPPSGGREGGGRSGPAAAPRPVRVDMRTRRAA